jgi:hypothetical protein
VVFIFIRRGSARFLRVPPARACAYHLHGRARITRVGKKAASVLSFVRPRTYGSMRLCGFLSSFVREAPVPCAGVRVRATCVGVQVSPAWACAYHLRGRARTTRTGKKAASVLPFVRLCALEPKVRLWFFIFIRRGSARFLRVPPARACAYHLHGHARITRVGKKAASVLAFVRPRTYGSMRLCGFYLHS